ncbi:hypothetical protein BC834DRAFT_1039864 [Gloeopeniophorella convolvens]|nr:hypothetical protein BC834DRAFT_1039864 [Gloeopeniophorella convolvens]
MSFSIDDLVASFATSHVSQEAMDIATLQTQLAKTLCYPAPAQPGPAHPVTRRNSTSYAQPCNTPTHTAPAFHWDDPRFLHPVDDDMADDQAVEDLLGARAPASPTPTTAAHRFRPAQPPHSPPFDAPGGASSLFASADSFGFAPPMQAAPSFFAQAARPAPGSPFAHTHQLESRAMLVAAGQR